MRSSFVKTLLLLLFSAACYHCGEDKIPVWVGTWQAVELVENNRTVDVDSLLEKVVLGLDNESHYTFTSTLRVRESGTYRIRKDRIYLQTTEEKKAKQERQMDILSMSNDSLVLLMTTKDQKRILKFCKV